MLIRLNNKEQANAIASYRKESFDYLTKDYCFRLKEDFSGLGIRYLNYYQPDETLLIANTHNGRVHLINLATGDFRSFLNHTASVRKIIMFNGDIYTSSWDRTIRVTNYLNFQQKIKLTDRYMGRIPYINISPDGRYLFSFSYDSDVRPGSTNMVRKWSMKSGQLLQSYEASGLQTNSCRSGSVLINENLIYVGSDNESFRVYDLRTGKAIRDIIVFADIRSMTSLFEYNYIMASDWNGYIRFYNIKKHCFDFKIKAHDTDIMTIRIHPENPGIVISASADGVIRFWKLPEFKLVNSIEVGHRDLWSIVFVKNNLLIGNIDGEILVYDISDMPDVVLKGRIVLSNRSYVVQVKDEKMFYTNDISSMEVYRKDDKTRITGKESEYLLGQGNSLMALRELFGISDEMNSLLSGKTNYQPLLKDSYV